MHYPMHSMAGQYKITQLWLKGKYFWLQPLIMIKDFLREGPKINFTEISQLRQYVGNQIAFYFTWKSFNICLWGLLSIPGLLYYMYIKYTGNYYSPYAIYWILLSQMFFTVQIQLW